MRSSVKYLPFPKGDKVVLGPWRGNMINFYSREQIVSMSATSAGIVYMIYVSMNYNGWWSWQIINGGPACTFASGTYKTLAIAKMQADKKARLFGIILLDSKHLSML